MSRNVAASVRARLKQIADFSKQDFNARPQRREQRRRHSRGTLWGVPDTAAVEAPEPTTFAAFIAWLTARGAQRRVIALMAEFAAMAGSRRIDFLHLTLPQIYSIAGRIRTMRAKQHGGSTRVESVGITPKMEELVRRLRAFRGRMGACTSSRPATAIHTLTPVLLRPGSERWPRRWKTR